MIRRIMGVAAALVLLGSGCAEPGGIASPAAARSTAPALLPLTITSGGRIRRFRVEVARTGPEQERGLMFRRSLPAHGGMLFPFAPPRPASFWMKNTVIPLDMLFIREDGSIARIAANATPYSLDPIGVEEPVAAVLELAGGKAAALGITARSRVAWQGGPRP